MTEVTGNPWFVLTSKLKRVKLGLKNLNRSRGNLCDVVNTARNVLTTFQECLPVVPSTEQLIEESRLKTSLFQALDKEEKLLKQKSCIKWLKHGDGNNRFFLNSCKGRWNTNKLVGLEDANGSFRTSHREIVGIAVNYFEELLGSPKAVEDFPTDLHLPSLTTEQAEFLDCQFSNADIYKVFKSMAKKKSPGPDGFTLEFFVAAWSIVGKDVTEGIQYFFTLVHCLVLLMPLQLLWCLKLQTLQIFFNRGPSPVVIRYTNVLPS